MKIFEKFAEGIRHLPLLNRLELFWNTMRPAYELLLRIVYRKGLPRTFNGHETFYVCHECRTLAGMMPHEVDWWKRFIEEAKKGDTVVEVGAYIGLYTIPLAKRVGSTGKIIVFEPNPYNLTLLKRNILLNRLSERVECLNMAANDCEATLKFIVDGSISHVDPSSQYLSPGSIDVKAISLDEVIGYKKVDLLKIDVEGAEQRVLSGAKQLLNRSEGFPRFISLECHPYMWKAFQTSSEDILSILRNASYSIEMPTLQDGVQLDQIQHHCIIFARKQSAQFKIKA